MKALFQKTLCRTVHAEGIGLHSGRPARLRLRPGPTDAGLVFVRTDLDPPVRIRASVFYVAATHRATTLGVDGVRVSTVEHVLSALYALGIDNAEIECDGEELPALDGSAAPYVGLIREAGIRTQRRSKRLLWIRGGIEVREGESVARLLPSEHFSVTCTLEYDHPLLRRRTYSLKLLPGLGESEYEREIAPARTFGLLGEVESLLARGLALGGSLENTVIIGERSVVNGDGLRFEDEFVRHKVLDSIGDLALLGLPVVGRFEGERSGHSLHARLVRAVLDRPDCWEIIEPNNQMLLPLARLQPQAPIRAPQPMA